MRDAVVRPLRPEANLFCGCLRLGSGPFCVSGLLFLVAKRKSGWGFAGRPVFFVLFLVCCDLPALPDLLGPCTMMFYCLCSCKDRARVRHRPYSRKKNVSERLQK